MARPRLHDNFDPSMDPNGGQWPESGPQPGGVVAPPKPDSVLRQFEGPGGDIDNHNLPNYREGRESTPPRLRTSGNATPKRPSSPTPMAGSTQMAMEHDILPFDPMRQPDQAMLAEPIGSGQQLRQAGLFGSLGGLQGGGLGTPFDPSPNEDVDMIETLLQKLMGGGGGMTGGGMF